LAPGCARDDVTLLSEERLHYVYVVRWVIDRIDSYQIWLAQATIA
jgi:hypothetical protein